LVIVIGLALFAFIAGDAWKVVQPHQSRDVGEVNGEALSVEAYQAMVDEYSEMVKLTQGISSLTDEQSSQLRDQVWGTYVNNKLVEKEAKALGLTVTDAEIQDILNTGTHPIFQMLPFFMNPQTRRFDRDALNKFLVQYAALTPENNSQTAEEIRQVYKVWQLVQKTLRENRLAEKYQAIISKALLANPVGAQDAFDARVNQYNLQMAAIPYSSVPDSTIQVKESELKDLYKQKKEEFKQYQETRDIKYIDVQVTASAEDKAATQKEADEGADQLKAATGDYASVVRFARSETPYVDLFYSKSAFPADVAARLDSVSGAGEVYGPYNSVMDNTLTSFKLIAKDNRPDSIQYRRIQLPANLDATQVTTTADSVYKAIKGGADFAELAKKYGQPGDGEPIWLASSQYERTQLDENSVKYIGAIDDAQPKQLQNMQIGQAHIIFEVMARKAMVPKYKVAVVKTPINFSDETYNRAYNDLSQFVAANGTLEKMEANAEEAGYRLLDRSDLGSAENVIGGVRGTKEALRWVFDKAKPGQVSPLYDRIGNNNDHILVVALARVNPEGYRSINDVQGQLRAELVKDKKAEKIMADLKAANATTLEQYEALPGAVTDTLKLVTFSAPAYIPSLHSSEPLVSAYASAGEMGKLSAPIKGNAGVMVLNKYGEEKLNETFDEKTEETTLENTYTRLASRLMQDLYLKAKVKDDRYKFF
jgi:peptidyl-prolyl cis-trans isomerase D